jgi:hypothetical protein
MVRNRQGLPSWACDLARARINHLLLAPQPLAWSLGVSSFWNMLECHALIEGFLQASRISVRTSSLVHLATVKAVAAASA